MLKDSQNSMVKNSRALLMNRGLRRGSGMYRYKTLSILNWLTDPVVQLKLPSEGKPLGIILYADKSKLSSFGTQMGYPVIAWCANLPIEIQNGKGLGGGRVVEWLPIVSLVVAICRKVMTCQLGFWHTGSRRGKREGQNALCRFQTHHLAWVC